MTLYRDFASHYDAVFPVDTDTVGFLTHAFRRGRILDLGCATGGYVLALRERGFRADGIDLDPRMIEIAREKATAVGTPATFGVADIRSLSADKVYDGVFCIGNTLVHLASEAEIRATLRRIFFALVSGGTAVIQIVNYDRILDRRITALPTIRNAGTTFTRSYVFDGGTVRFRTRLDAGGASYAADTPLFPLRARALEAGMASAGFAGIVLHGDFDQGPFDPGESIYIVAEGVKP